MPHQGKHPYQNGLLLLFVYFLEKRKYSVLGCAVADSQRVTTPWDHGDDVLVQAVQRRGHIEMTLVSAVSDVPPPVPGYRRLTGGCRYLAVSSLESPTSVGAHGNIERAFESGSSIWI